MPSYPVTFKTTTIAIKAATIAILLTCSAVFPSTDEVTCDEPEGEPSPRSPELSLPFSPCIHLELLGPMSEFSCAGITKEEAFNMASVLQHWPIQFIFPDGTKCEIFRSTWLPDLIRWTIPGHTKGFVVCGPAPGFGDIYIAKSQEQDREGLLQLFCLALDQVLVAQECPAMEKIREIYERIVTAEQEGLQQLKINKHAEPSTSSKVPQVVISLLKP